MCVACVAGAWDGTGVEARSYCRLPFFRIPVKLGDVLDDLACRVKCVDRVNGWKRSKNDFVLAGSGFGVHLLDFDTASFQSITDGVEERECLGEIFRVEGAP